MELGDDIGSGSEMGKARLMREAITTIFEPDNVGETGCSVYIRVKEHERCYERSLLEISCDRTSNGSSVLFEIN